jgi:hypothetical protein
MLLDIITDTIALQPDMAIVGQDAKTASLAETAESTNPDIIILTRSTAAADEDFDELLYRRAHLKVLEIFDKGYGSLHELRPRHVELGEMSPPRLVEVIRESVASRTESGR